MSISAESIKIESTDSKGKCSWMESYRLGYGYVNGVRFHPGWGVFALLREKAAPNGHLFLMAFPSEEFLSDYENHDQFEIVQRFK